MANSKAGRALVALVIILLTVSASTGGDVQPLATGPRDRCPVCGMFVAKYPDFLAGIVHADGTVAFFDGVKDMMKYYFNLQKYAPGKTLADITRINVTDYYRLEQIDGRRAFYVVGSDVFGPMGKELIPFENREEAQEFLQDHKASAILTFQEIDPPLLEGLD